MVALVTDEFWDQASFVARAEGMPSVPKVRLPHPIAGTGDERMATVAEEIADEVIRLWTERPST